MNVRELVTVLKFKTDSASLKSAENAIKKIKRSMAGIKPKKVSIDTSSASRQMNHLTQQVNSATNALNRFSRAQTRASQAHYRGKAQGLAQSKAQNTAQAGGIAGSLKGAFVALGGLALLNEIKQTADAMMSLSSRIRLVTKDDAERLQVEQRLYQMSMKNRASLEDIGDLYYKTALSAKRFGATQEDVLRLTDIVSKSLIIGGADTAQQKATILQLSQALGSGVLQGDELRSLRENAPILMNKIAEYFGKSMAELKEMGAKGELTTEKLMQAILASGQTIDKEFKVITPTIGQALTLIGNKWSKLILDIQNSTGVFGTIAGFIIEGVDLIGQAIDWVVKEFGTATPEMMGMLQDFKDLWKSLQPLISAIGTIFMNLVVPAMKMFGRVASAVLGAVAQLLQPIADLLGRIAGLIATASGGMSGLIAKAESGAIERYNNIKMSQNNTFNLASETQLQPAMASTSEFFPDD